MEGAARLRAREEPGEIRDALTEKHIAADGKLARFVGIEAYEKAGGAVLRDLFEDGNAWLTDPALLNQLAAGKLDEAAEAVRGEGWKWVEIMPDLAWDWLKPFGHAESEAVPPTAEQQQEIDKLTAEADAILEQHGDEPDEEIAAHYYELRERIEELAEGGETWPAEAKANAGTIIAIDHKGDLDIRRGLIRPEDKAAARKAAKAKDGDTNGKTAEAGHPACPPRWSKT